MRRRVLAHVARALVCAAVYAGAPAAAWCQPSYRSVDLVTSISAVGGVTPLVVEGVRQHPTHVGGRLDAAIQGKRLSLGVGLRIWQVVPDRYDAGGGDLFVHGEWRAERAARTSVRAGSGLALSTAGADSLGFRERRASHVWWMGIGHELPTLWTPRVLLFADLLLPSADADGEGRRAPVLEVGVGIRRRFMRGIRL